MSAFPDFPVTNSIDNLRIHASTMNYDQCFDGHLMEIYDMEEKGKDGVLYCLCKVDTPCPCPESVGEIEKKGQCYCGIFRRKEPGSR